jgi:hypothetical protein
MIRCTDYHYTDVPFNPKPSDLQNSFLLYLVNYVLHLTITTTTTTAATEGVDVALTLLIRIRDVLNLNLRHPEGFRGFPQFPQANPGTVPRLDHGRLHSNLFEIIIYLSSLHTALCNLAAESVVK